MSCQEQTLVESPFPQPLGMKGHRHYQEAIHSIQMFSDKGREKGPQGFGQMTLSAVFELMDSGHEGSFI